MEKESVKNSPDFEKPPVIEVVCGVLFEPLEIQGPHLGLFWDKIRSDYPLVDSVVPIIPSIERFDENPQPDVEFENPLHPRIWFRHKDGNALIQVQKDRLLFNWKQGSSNDFYPRYDNVFREFKQIFKDFSDFVQKLKIGTLRHRQYELTYVNHIDIGVGWTKFSEIGSVMPDFAWRKDDDRFLPDPEAFNWKTTFRLPERAGRLHVSAQTARKTLSDKTPLLRLDMTARGFPDSIEDQDMDEWFDVAHNWIVNGFVDLTSEKFQKQVWGAKF